MIKTLFADRDGTIIQDKHYLSNPAGVKLLDHVGESLKRIQNAGIQIFLVTNQSGIGRGYFQENDFFACQKELDKQLSAYGVSIVETAFCPHTPEAKCSCRKPNIEMWHDLAKKYSLQPEHCAMIGDKKDDVYFGIHAGFNISCLIATGKGTETAQTLNISFEHSAKPFIPSQDTNTTCITAINFEQFTDYLLNNR